MDNGLPLREINPDALSEISSIDVDCCLSVPERIKSFYLKTKSPYLFTVKGRTVKVVFDGLSEKNFEDAFIAALKRIAQIDN